VVALSSVKSIKMVYAKWCPHCVPTTLNAMSKAASELGAKLELYDIDNPQQVKIADELVKKYGDWSEDYVIPQVFFEYQDGKIEHVFTGQRQGVSASRSKLDELFKSQKYASLKAAVGN
jgi:thiol-disulfide isomerase/thioredoxin